MVMLKRIGKAIAAMAVFMAAPAIAGPAPVISLGRQQLIGSEALNGVASFRGIAYARPPIGALRWKAPQMLAARSGKFDATEFGPACPQSEGNTRWYRNVAKAMGADPAVVPSISRIAEDCLYLNVWTPTPWPLIKGRRLPVMVWFHGGSNENGYSHEPNYLGAHLARQGIVLVSVNYRLGLLGFFAHPSLGADASGRQGLLDQVAALRWIHANIVHFGGDAEQVTIFGESAGGTDTAALAVMPEAKGLFARVIIQSGFLPTPTKAGDGAFVSLDAARQLAESLFGTKTSAASLRAMPWQNIVAKQQERLPGHFYAPVASQPQKLTVSLLIGSNADEHLMYLPPDRAGQEAMLEHDLSEVSASNRAEVMAMIGKIPGTEANRVDAVSAGKAFHCPVMRLANASADRGQKVFVYRFERVRPGHHGLGAYHGAEIPYVFDSHDAWLPTDSADTALATIVQNYWVNFARTGEPNGPGLPVWPQWHSKSPVLLGLSEQIAAKPMPQSALCKYF